MNEVIPKCFKNIFSNTDPPCPKTAIWAGAGTGNVTDSWTWCSQHSPAPEWRKPLKETLRRITTMTTESRDERESLDQVEKKQ